MDDGSTDGSSNVYSQYSNSDTRFIVCKQKNEGVARARNKGLELAHGEYIVFVDADDKVEETYVEELYLACLINGVSLSVCGRWYVKNGVIKQQIEKESIVYNCIDALKVLLLGVSASVGSSPWGKMYRKELFNEVKYPVGIVYEDTATTWKLFVVAQQIAVVPKALYYYEKREQSITLSNEKTVREDQINAAKSVQNEIDGLFPELSKYALRFYLDHTLEYLKCDKISPKEAMVIQKEWRRGYKLYLCDDTLSIKTKIRVLINTFFPVQLLRFLYKML